MKFLTFSHTGFAAVISPPPSPFPGHYYPPPILRPQRSQEKPNTRAYLQHTTITHIIRPTSTPCFHYRASNFPPAPTCIPTPAPPKIPSASRQNNRTRSASLRYGTYIGEVNERQGSPALKRGGCFLQQRRKVEFSPVLVGRLRTCAVDAASFSLVLVFCIDGCGPVVTLTCP